MENNERGAVQDIGRGESTVGKTVVDSKLVEESPKVDVRKSKRGRPTNAEEEKVTKVSKERGTIEDYISRIEREIDRQRIGKNINKRARKR